MRRMTLLAALVLAAAPLSAQGFIGGGITTPMGDAKDAVKTGWIVNGGYRPFQSADKRMSIWAEGIYASTKAKVGDSKSTMMGGFGSITYNLTADASAVPYVIGSVGYLANKPEGGSSEGALGFGGGVGVGIKKFYLESRYLTSSKNGYTNAFIMWTAGYTF